MATAGISQYLGLMSSLGSVLFAGSIYLVERRGKREQVHPQWQVDISSLLESIPEAALIIDTDHRIIDCNTAAAQILGIAREELVKSDTRKLGHMLGDAQAHGQRYATLLARALQGESIRDERRTVQRRDSNETVELLISATPLHNERGDVIAALLIARDTTELHVLQRRIVDVERHLAIGQMAASLAHDFNNILAAIEQAAYILQGEATPNDKEHRAVVAIIQNAVRRGSEIISRVRDYLRTGSGVLGPVDIRQVVTEAVELTRPLWSKAGITTTCRLQLVPTVLANAADMRRVFTNLLINATEAMQGGGELVVTCQEHEGQIVATVSDTGKGIAPEIRKKIFYPYFTTKLKGTGLGLSGAQKIVLAQGGNISFRSEVNKGTTFIVTLRVNGKNGERLRRDDKKVAA
jgi:PAS domain S-box-containing protein